MLLVLIQRLLHDVLMRVTVFVAFRPTDVCLALYTDRLRVIMTRLSRQLLLLADLFEGLAAALVMLLLLIVMEG